MTSTLSPFNVPGPRELFHDHGNLVALAQGGRTRLYSPRPTCPGTVFACGPEMVRQVTMNHDIYYKYPLTGPMYRVKDKSARTSPLKHYLVGLFGVNEQDHLQQRKLMMPAFHRQRLESYAQGMIAIAHNELNQLQPGKGADIAAAMRQITLRIATKSLFGEDISNKGGSTGEIIHEALRLQMNVLMKLLPFDIPGLPWHR